MGQQYVVYEPSESFAGMVLGMPYVEFDVPKRTAKGIADFYSKVLGTRTSVEGRRAAHVSVGYGQELVFRETEKPQADYDGHHIQVYVANFSKPHKALVERKILTEESNQYQYRFNDIVDPASGKKLFEIEHEIRSITHPLYARPLVNRNPRQTNRNYVQGRDGWVPEWEDADWATSAAPCASSVTRKPPAGRCRLSEERSDSSLLSSGEAGGGAVIRDGGVMGHSSVVPASDAVRRRHLRASRRRWKHSSIGL